MANSNFDDFISKHKQVVYDGQDGKYTGYHVHLQTELPKIANELDKHGYHVLIENHMATRTLDDSYVFIYNSYIPTAMGDTSLFYAMNIN